MSVFRINKNKNYTVMSNHHLQNKNLSFKAKGLLSYMLSLPDDWNYTLEGLCTAGKDNKAAIRTALQELKDNEYLIVNKLQPNESKTGRIDYEYIIFEIPQNEKQGSKIKRCFSDAENRTLQNTNNKILNKKKTTKKKKTNTNKANFTQREYTDEQLNELVGFKNINTTEISDT